MVRETESSPTPPRGATPPPEDCLRFVLLAYPAHPHHRPAAGGHHH
jgi:hypothetical protein